MSNEGDEGRNLVEMTKELHFTKEQIGVLNGIIRIHLDVEVAKAIQEIKKIVSMHKALIDDNKETLRVFTNAIYEQDQIIDMIIKMVRDHAHVKGKGVMFSNPTLKPEELRTHGE